MCFGVLGDGEWVKQNTGVAGRWIYLDVESEVIRIVGIGWFIFLFHLINTPCLNPRFLHFLGSNQYLRAENPSCLLLLLGVQKQELLGFTIFCPYCFPKKHAHLRQVKHFPQITTYGSNNFRQVNEQTCISCFQFTSAVRVNHGFRSATSGGSNPRCSIIWYTYPPVN